MRHKIQESLLMALPLLLALAVGLGMPALQPAETARLAPHTDFDETLALACEASHRATAAPATLGDPASRTQSPAWQQQHRAAVELCLRDGLRVMRTARAGS